MSIWLIVVMSAFSGFLNFSLLKATSEINTYNGDFWLSVSIIFVVVLMLSMFSLFTFYKNDTKDKGKVLCFSLVKFFFISVVVFNIFMFVLIYIYSILSHVIN